MAFDVPELPLHEAAPVFAVLLLAVLLAPALARLVRLPEVVVLVLLGVAVGPGATGLLARDGVVEALGGAGVLVLLFLAGLELDLDDFAATRADSLRFGVLTFAVPLVLGTVAALALGLGLLPSVLLGSCWSSHTLLAYPQFRRAGTAGHRAVATTVGATIVTDVAALLVLVVVVRADQGALGALFWVSLGGALVVLVVGTLVLLPRLARRYFGGAGQDPRLRLLFVLTCLFGVAAVTGLLGVEPIIGAFLAGLALNRSVPRAGPLFERLDLLAQTLFVPLFLLATGMLVDLRLLAEPAVLVQGLVFAAVATLGKLLAAVLAGRWLRSSRDEVLAMFGLSEAQAAATLAAVIVGRQAGLLAQDTVNAVVLVVLATCVVSSLVSERVAGRLPGTTRTRALGAVVVVPVANPATAGALLRLGATIARADAGLVVPLVVAPTAAGHAAVDVGRSLLAELAGTARADGAEVTPVLRVDASLPAGIAGTVAEYEASLLVLGWQGVPALPTVRVGGAVDSVLDRVTTPTLVVHDAGGPTGRVLVLLPSPGPAQGATSAALALALRAAAVVARDARAPVTVVATGADRGLVALVRARLGQDVRLVPGRRSLVDAADVRDGDTVVVPSDAVVLRSVLRLLRDVPASASVVLCVAQGE